MANTLVKYPIFFKDSPSPQHKATSELEALSICLKGSITGNLLFGILFTLKNIYPHQKKKENTHQDHFKNCKKQTTHLQVKSTEVLEKHKS